MWRGVYGGVFLFILFLRCRERGGRDNSECTMLINQGDSGLWCIRL